MRFGILRVAYLSMMLSDAQNEVNVMSFVILTPNKQMYGNLGMSM